MINLKDIPITVICGKEFTYNQLKPCLDAYGRGFKNSKEFKELSESYDLDYYDVAIRLQRLRSIFKGSDEERVIAHMLSTNRKISVAREYGYSREMLLNFVDTGKFSNGKLKPDNLTSSVLCSAWV